MKKRYYIVVAVSLKPLTEIYRILFKILWKLKRENHKKQRKKKSNYYKIQCKVNDTIDIYILKLHCIAQIYQALQRMGDGGEEAGSISPSPKFSINVTFFLMSPLHVPFLKKINQKYKWKLMFYPSKLK